MYGLSSSGKESIVIAVEKMFDSLAYKLLGNIPKLRSKSPFFGSQSPFSLAHIFIQALNNKEPNHFEKDVLRSILNSSFGYVEALKNRTSSNVVESVDAIVKEAKLRGQYVSPTQITEIIAEEMGKAKNHMKLIAEAESTKTRNMAHTMEIVDKSKKEEVSDPTVFFIIVRDNKTCLEENEIVLTTTGAVPIGSIQVGDLMKNPSTPSQRKGNRVLAIEKKIKETIELDFGDSKIVCTKDHPILVRFGKILCFMEADRITEDHDVVLIDEIKNKGDFKMITRAMIPRDFMKKLGYVDAWDFWRENIDDMILIAKTKQSRIPIMKKYGINLDMWDKYVIHILRGYDKNIKFIGRSIGNNFNAHYIKIRSETLKCDRHNKYISLGGDSWLTEQIKNTKNCKTLAAENNLSIKFLRERVRSLGLLPMIKARGAKSNWDKNREHLIKMQKQRGTPHFKPISKPEIKLGDELLKIFTDLKRNFSIGNIKVDFFIPSINTIVEYDGSGHNLRDKLVGNKTDKITNHKDFARDKFVKNLGFRVFRIKAPKDKFDSNSIISSIQNFVLSSKEFGVWQS
jgi:very-short-patch-repair endonuclease